MLKNKVWQLVGAVVVLSIAIVVMVNSCGSGDSYDQWGGMTKEEFMAQKKKRAEAEKAEEQAAKEKKKAERAERMAKAAEPANNSKKPRRTSPAPTSGHSKESEEENLTAEELLKRRRNVGTKANMPADFAAWKPEDFYTARGEGNKELAKAVDWLGKQSGDKQLAVEILVKLLEPPADSSIGDSAKKTRYSKQAKLVEAIVDALADNGTPAAWEAIERIALRKIVAEEPKAAAIEAVKMLAEHPSPATEESLLRVAVAAAQPVPDEYGREETIEINEEILEVIEKSALDPFKVRLAFYIAGPDVSRQAFDKLWPCMKRKTAGNLIPQSIVFQSSMLSAADSDEIVKLLVPESGTALWRLFDVPPGSIGGKNTAKPSVSDYASLADRLWTADFASAVGRRLLVIETLEKSKDSILLATSLPLGSVRGALHRALELHWEEGPKALEKSGIGEDFVPEPGFLAVLKELPRKDQPAGSRAASKRPAGGRDSRSKSEALLDARRKRDETAYEWMAFSEKATLAMCRRFYDAAMARSGAELVAAEDLDSDKLPVKPHPGAEIVAQYRSSWPKDLKGRIADPPPLRVHYIRIEQRAKPKALLGYYRRQLPGREEHEIDEGAWLDSLAASPEKSLVRSIDVLITSPGIGNRELANSEQRLVVEILSVDCEPVKTE